MRSGTTKQASQSPGRNDPFEYVIGVAEGRLTEICQHPCSSHKHQVCTPQNAEDADPIAKLLRNPHKSNASHAAQLALFSGWATRLRTSMPGGYRDGCDVVPFLGVLRLVGDTEEIRVGYTKPYVVDHGLQCAFIAQILNAEESE